MGSFRFILILLGALDFYWWRWADVRLKPLKRSGLWRGLLAAFMLIQFAGLGARAFRPGYSRIVNAAMPTPLVVGQYLWSLLILPLAIVIPMLFRLIRFADRGVRHLMKRGMRENRIAPIARFARVASSPAPSRVDGMSADFSEHDFAASGSSHHPTRREVLTALGAAVPPLLLAGIASGGVEQLGKFRIRPLTLSLPRLPKALDGLTIAHVADLHMGRFMQPQMLPAIVAAVNDLRCDLVAFTGDLIDFTLVDLPAALSAIKQMEPREKLVCCVGNHDLFENGPEFIRRTRTAGVAMLVDEAMTLRVRGQAVQILGIDWHHGDLQLAASVARVARLRRDDAFPILLSHHPHAFDAAAEHGFPLTLSGHTHGGQLMLTNQIGAGSILFRYISGPYYKKQSALVVANGVGNWFPLRINAPAEIIRLTLRRA